MDTHSVERSDDYIEITRVQREVEENIFNKPAVVLAARFTTFDNISSIDPFRW